MLYSPEAILRRKWEKPNRTKRQLRYEDTEKRREGDYLGGGHRRNGANSSLYTLTMHVHPDCREFHVEWR